MHGLSDDAASGVVTALLEDLTTQWVSAWPDEMVYQQWRSGAVADHG